MRVYIVHVEIDIYQIQGIIAEGYFGKVVWAPVIENRTFTHIPYNFQFPDGS